MNAKTGHFDLLVIGDDAPGLCAAACAASAGARVAVARTPSDAKRRRVAGDAIPNFVWRRLDLQKYDISATPVSAIVSVSTDGKIIKTHADAGRAADAIEEAGVEDHIVWPDFVREIEELTQGADRLATRLALGRKPKGVNGESDRSYCLDDLTVLASSCEDFLDDYFEDDRLKTHVGVRALAASGLGGKEAGSASALSGMFEASSWPARVFNGASSLEKTLEIVCADAGATVLDAAFHSIDSTAGKHLAVRLSDSEVVKARYVFCPSPDAARRAGLAKLIASPTFANGAARATITISLSDDVDPPGGIENAIFHVVDDLGDLQDARDAVVEGRLPEKLPLEFQFAPPREIIAYTSYCPDRFMEEGAPREWTSQDRQALGARAVEQIAPHVAGLSGKVIRSQVTVDGAYSSDDDELTIEVGDPRIVVQSTGANAIAAAVTLADHLLNGD